MSELREEQEMEAEALEAIFMESFKVVKDSQPFRWSVRLAPVDCGGDAVEDEKENHVVVNLLAEIPLDYPESSPPEIDVEVVRGLAEEQRRQILDLAKEEAEANAGMAAIFTVCEAVREWLGENNIKGQDDGSMYAQMIWKQNEAEKAKVSASRRGRVGWGGGRWDAHQQIRSAGFYLPRDQSFLAGAATSTGRSQDPFAQTARLRERGTDKVPLPCPRAWRGGITTGAT